MSIRQEYPDIARQAIRILLPFAITHLCESAFLTLALMKNKRRSNLQTAEQELRVSLPDIKLRIQRLCAQKQTYLSH